MKTPSAARKPTDAATALHQLFDADWKYSLAECPELSTFYGVRGNDHRWTDHSFEAIERRRKHPHKVLAALQAIDRKRLDAADQLNYDLFLRGTRESIEGEPFEDELMPVSQMGGVHQDVGRFITMMTPFSAEDYENMVARLRAVPVWVEQTIALMERGVRQGIVPPRVTLEDVPRQLERQLACKSDENPLLGAFQRFPASVPAARRKALSRDGKAALEKAVVPAFQRLHSYLVEAYLPRSRSSIALGDLPNGQEWYAFRARAFTTTRQSPRELHDLGLREVARIRAEIERRMRATGFKRDFAAFGEFMRTDPRFFHTDAGALVAEYRDICKRADPGLVKLFGHLPRLPYGVQATPKHTEKSAPMAYYQPGSLAAGRPGWYFATAYNLKARPRWEMEALTLHEAVPGHHLQLSLAQEMTGVPEFRRHGHFTAFIEGWALYAESLGDELGFYTDPYSKLGQLNYEIFRSCRLVVDTGIHALGWSRKKALDYMLSNSFKTRHQIVADVDRYVAMPGQALAYKVGELAFQRLRKKATQALGDRFDLRAFHDELLAHGALPLDLLESRMEEWMGEQGLGVRG